MCHKGRKIFSNRQYVHVLCSIFVLKILTSRVFLGAQYPGKYLASNSSLPVFYNLHIIWGENSAVKLMV